MPNVHSLAPRVASTAKASTNPSHATVREIRDSARGVVAAIVNSPVPAAGASAAAFVACDVDALRFAASIATASECKDVFVATSSATVRALDPTFARALKAHSTGGDSLGVLIRCPIDVDEAAAALHFAARCAAQGARLALELPEHVCASSWEVACSMAGAIDASVVIVSGRTIIKLYGGRGARGARAMVSRLVHPGASLYATAVDGPALQALCERVGVRGFEFARSLAPVAIQRSVVRATPARPHHPRVSRLGLIAAAALSVAACSSVPKPAVPDGTTRVPVNDPDRIAMLQKQAEFQVVAIAQSDETRKEVVALRQQVQQLSTALKLLAIAPQLDAPRVDGDVPTPTVSRRPVSGSTSLGRDKPLPAGQESRAVESTRDGMIFRVFHPTGEANFAPDGKFAEALRAAAVSGSAIEVRGFTDSPVDDGADRRVALARSSDARQWLVDQGVDPKQIVCRSSSHGHFLGENATPSGRALNRRVEIEIRGDTTQAVAILNRKKG